MYRKSATQWGPNRLHRKNGVGGQNEHKKYKTGMKAKKCIKIPTLSMSREEMEGRGSRRKGGGGGGWIGLAVVDYLLLLSY